MDAKARPLAEEAIRALGRGDAASARTFIAEAVVLDHSLEGLADLVHLGCSEIEEEEQVSVATWNGLADAVASAGLLAVVESSRP
jgi:hypothetical protein